jgi:hypothetical protein
MDLASMVRNSLFGFNARVAAPALGTAVTSRQPVSVPPPYQQDEVAIAAGHAQRRDMLARRRAEQQLTIVMQDSQRLGVQVSTEQIVNLVTDTVDAVRACARR